MNGRAAILAAAVLLLAGAPAHSQQDVTVHAQRSGGAIDLRAEAAIEAAPALVWSVIRDYERLPQFIPGLKKSVVVSREGNRVVIEQSGHAGFLFFTVPIEVRLEVQESPPDSIVSRAIGGNLRRLTGRYDVRPGAAPGWVTLQYAGVIEPGFDLPPIIGMAALQSSVEAQFEAMVREIRRQAAAR